MQTVLLVLIVSTVVIAGIMIGTIWMVKFYTNIFVDSNHHNIEEIVEKQDIPSRWSKKYEIALQKLSSDADFNARKIKLVEHAHVDFFKKLYHLEKYVIVTRLVQDEEIRNMIVESLHEVKKKVEGKKENEL